MACIQCLKYSPELASRPPCLGTFESTALCEARSLVQIASVGV